MAQRSEAQWLSHHNQEDETGKHKSLRYISRGAHADANEPPRYINEGTHSHRTSNGLLLREPFPPVATSVQRHLEPIHLLNRDRQAWCEEGSVMDN